VIAYVACVDSRDGRRRGDVSLLQTAAVVAKAGVAAPNLDADRRPPNATHASPNGEYQIVSLFSAIDVFLLTFTTQN
jgi:hypothetical protein